MLRAFSCIIPSGDCLINNLKELWFIKTESEALNCPKGSLSQWMCTVLMNSSDSAKSFIAYPSSSRGRFQDPRTRGRAWSRITWSLHSPVDLESWNTENMLEGVLTPPNTKFIKWSACRFQDLLKEWVSDLSCRRYFAEMWQPPRHYDINATRIPLCVSSTQAKRSKYPHAKVQFTRSTDAFQITLSRQFLFDTGLRCRLFNSMARHTVLISNTAGS